MWVFFTCVSSQPFSLPSVKMYDYRFLSMQRNCFLISVILVIYNSGLGRQTLCHSCGVCLWIHYEEVMGSVAEGGVPA